MALDPPLCEDLSQQNQIFMSEAIQNDSEGMKKAEDPEVRAEAKEEVKVEIQEKKEQTQEVVGLTVEHEEVVHVEAANTIQNEENKIEVVQLKEEKNAHEQAHQHNEEVILPKDMENVQQSAAEQKQAIEHPTLTVYPEIKETVEHLDNEQKKTQEHVQAEEKEQHHQKVQEVEHREDKEEKQENEVQPQQQIVFQEEINHDVAVADIQAVEESRTQKIEPKEQISKEDQFKYPQIEEKPHTKEHEPIHVQDQKENSSLVAQQKQVENIVEEEHGEKIQPAHEREEQIVSQEHTLQKSVTQQDNVVHVEAQEEKIDENKDKPIQPHIEYIPQPQTNFIQPQATDNLQEQTVQKHEKQPQIIDKIQQVKNEEAINHEMIQAQKVEQIKKQEQNTGTLNQAIIEKESLQEQQIVHAVPTQTVEKQQVYETNQVQNQPKEVSQQQILQIQPVVESKPQEVQIENKQQIEVVHVQQEKVEQIHHDEHQHIESPITVTQTEKIQVNAEEIQEKYEHKEEPQPYQVKVDNQESIHDKEEIEQPHKEIVQVNEPETVEKNEVEEQQKIENHEEKIQQISIEKTEEYPIETVNIVEEHGNNNEHIIEQRNQQQQKPVSEAKEEITVENRIEESSIVPSNEAPNTQIHQNTEAVRKQSEHFKQEASQNKQVTISEAKAQQEYQMAASNKETANFKAEEQSESNHNNEEIAEPEEPIVQKQEIIAEIAVQKEHKIQQIQRVNEEEKPISEPSKQPQNPSIHSNKDVQSEEKQENIFQFTPYQQQQQSQKQKYRLNTQLIDNHQQKAKEQNFVEFVEFTPEEKIEIQYQTKQVVPIAKNEALHIASEENIDKQLNYTFLPPIQTKKSAEQAQKTIDILKGQLSNKKGDSSKQGVGKISRKNLFEKKVHDVIADLKKYDDQKPVKAEQERKFSSRKRKTDSATKHDNIGLKSNIINVTIGELLSKDQSEQAEKLLGQIDDLKKKLHELERKKELNMFTLEPSQKNIENESAQKDTIMSNKSAKKATGRIYRRADSNNSRVTEEIQTQGYMTQKSSVGFMNPSISSAPRQRLSSTQDFPLSKTASKEPEIENKTGPIIFRVKKNSKTTHGPFDFNLGEKETGYIKSKELEGEDKNFQTRREERQESSQERLTPIQKPAPRKLHFQEDFKKEVDRYFIELGNELPKRDWNQQQLTQTAKETFKKFGVSIVNEKKLVLCVKKYKNCVSFILDNARTILWYYQGKFYFGGWKINTSGEGQKNGWGYDYSPGKYVYSGNFIENKRDGHGIMKFLTRDNDVIYEGEWKNGFKHGIGKQRDIDGSEYIGSWVQGKKNGYGRIRVSDQEGYAGNFLNGVKNGEGSEKFKNGDSYEGSYYDGKFHGMGVYIWGNLSRYEGQFKQGSRNGNGIWISNYKDQNSDRYEGQYRNDRKNGFGVYKWKDGTVYQGEFLNDLKHGQGIVSYGDGKSTKLQWFEGNVVPRQNAERQRSGIKRPISKSNSKKTQEKTSQRNAPLIKFNGNQIKLKPTRVSLGMQQF